MRNEHDILAELIDCGILDNLLVSGNDTMNKKIRKAYIIGYKRAEEYMEVEIKKLIARFIPAK